jgi:thymidine kinase
LEPGISGKTLEWRIQRRTQDSNNKLLQTSETNIRIVMKEIQDRISELLSSLNYEDQNEVINNIRNENREKRMQEINFHESKAAEIRRSMNKL